MITDEIKDKYLELIELRTTLKKKTAKFEVNIFKKIMFVFD